MGRLTFGVMTEVPYAIIAAGAAIAGLWVSNIVYDLQVPHHISRKIGHAAGGLAFFVSAFLFSSAFWPMLLATLFTVLLLGARLAKKRTFRGVGRTGETRNVYSEVWFAGVAIPVYGVAWLWLAKPMVALAPLLFMAWGDCLTGITRAQVYHREVKGLWGSAAMLGVCLVIAWAFIQPFWIGAVAAAVTVATEWACGECGVVRWADDNWTVPLSSLAAIVGLLALTGNLF